MAWLHTWSGLVAGWLLFFVFVTGTAGYFDNEITRWMEPERPFSSYQTLGNEREAKLEKALHRLEVVAPNAESWTITLPHQSDVSRGWQEFMIAWQELPSKAQSFGTRGREQLDPNSVEPVEPPVVRATGGGNQLYRMHYALHYMPRDVGIRIVGICTMMMLLALLTGVVIHKKIFKDFFTFRPGKNRRSWMDAHNIFGVMALPFFLMITYSGLVFFALQYMPAGLATIYGTDRPSLSRFFAEFSEHNHQALAVSAPTLALEPFIQTAEKTWGKGQVAALRFSHDQGEPPVIRVDQVGGTQIGYEPKSLRFNALSGEPVAEKAPANLTFQTNQTLRALHEGLYAGPWLRWLYFVSGLLGCAMIGSGLILWSLKRQPKQAVQRDWGLKWVDALNLATVAGLPAGVAIYFWANRLLPLDIDNRGDWEINALFMVWGEVLLFGLLRNIRKAWVECFSFTAAAFALVPVINALTTHKHLGNTLLRGEWALAGVDLTCLALGVVFALLALRLKASWQIQWQLNKHSSHSATQSLPLQEGL